MYSMYDVCMYVSCVQYIHVDLQKKTIRTTTSYQPILDVCQDRGNIRNIYFIDIFDIYLFLY